MISLEPVRKSTLLLWYEHICSRCHSTEPSSFAHTHKRFLRNAEIIWRFINVSIWSVRLNMQLNFGICPRAYWGTTLSIFASEVEIYVDSLHDETHSFCWQSDWANSDIDTSWDMNLLNWHKLNVYGSSMRTGVGHVIYPRAYMPIGPVASFHKRPMYSGEINKGYLSLESRVESLLIKNFPESCWLIGTDAGGFKTSSTVSRLAISLRYIYIHKFRIARHLSGIFSRKSRYCVYEPWSTGLAFGSKCVLSVG